MENENEKTALQKPGFWRVILSYLLDSLFVSIFAIVLVVCTVGAGILFVWCVPILYFSLLDYYYGGSAGKQVCGIGVFMEKKSLGRVFLANVIDTMVSLGVMYILSWILKEIDIAALAGYDAVGGSMFGLLLVFLVFYCGTVLAFSTREALVGASLGKASMGIKVYQK